MLRQELRLEEETRLGLYLGIWEVAYPNAKPSCMTRSKTHGNVRHGHILGDDGQEEL